MYFQNDHEAERYKSSLDRETELTLLAQKRIIEVLFGKSLTNAIYKFPKMVEEDADESDGLEESEEEDIGSM